MTWPPPYMPRLVAIAGRTEEAVARGGAALRLREVLDELGGRRQRPRRPDLRQRRAQRHAPRADGRGRPGGQARHLREAARPRRGRELRDLEGGRRDRRQAHDRVQLPLLSGDPPREAADRRRRARRDLPLPRRAITRSGSWTRSSPRSGGSTRSVAGSGALGDLGAHVIDQSRYLVGEPAAVNGLLRDVHQGAARRHGRRRRRVPGHRRVRERRERDVRGDALRSSAARTRCAGRSTARRARSSSTRSGRTSSRCTSSGSTPGDHAQGFRDVLVSEAYHPYWEHWWPHGHMIGWEDNFVHELLHLLDVRSRRTTPIGPRGATMEDGYRCAEICDAIVRSHETGKRQRSSTGRCEHTRRQARVVTGASQGIGAGDRDRARTGRRNASRSTTRARRREAESTASAIRAGGRHGDRRAGRRRRPAPTSSELAQRAVGEPGAESTSGSTTRPADGEAVPRD